MRKQQHEVAYEQIAKEAAKFAAMIADFPKYGSGEFLKRYPDYNYDGTDYICRRAEQLAVALDEYAARNESGDRRRSRKEAAAEQVSA